MATHPHTPPPGFILTFNWPQAQREEATSGSELAGDGRRRVVVGPRFEALPKFQRKCRGELSLVLPS